MMKHSWIRNLLARPVVRPFRKRPPRARPRLETLEDRTVPSTFTVNNLLDDGSIGSLRWAVGQANASAGDDTINFDPGVFATAQTITLTGTQLELTDTSGTDSITGPAAGVTINGGGLSRVFQVDANVTASISGLTISGGSAGSANGGGLLNYGTATLTGCTVSGNSAFYGGGLANTGTLGLVNCTVSGNTINGYFGGGGLFNHGTSTLTNCTVSGNTSPGYGGIYNTYYGSTATLTNTIVAGNSGPFGDINFTPISGSNNLIGGNPLLAPLGNYGGPTETMALLPGSAAIDAGTSGAGIPSTDQRGLGRVGAVDIGAFESQGFTMTAVAGSTPQTSAIGTPFANPLAVTVVANNPMEPVNGGVVSFVANNVGGATAILSAPSAVISGGQASVMAEPNNADGSYTVVASATGASSVSFALTNTGPVLPLVVNTTIDSLFPGTGLLTLREAIAFANLDSAGISTITFDPTVFATPQTITLTEGQLELSNTTETETITGPAAGVTVNANNASRVFQVDGLVTASISGLTISNGSAFQAGGVLNDGNIKLTNCTVSGNSAELSGGLFNAGTATITDCTLTGNTANPGGCGGAIMNAFGATLTISNSSVSDNLSGFFVFGGGIFNSGTATVSDSTVSGNTVGQFGEGAGIWNAGSMTLSDSAVSGNSTDFFSGSGGGIFSFGTLTLSHSTVSGNSANNGGGIWNDSSLTASDSTLSGNSAHTNGGALFNIRGTATLTHCTVSGNSAVNGAGVWSKGAVGFRFNHGTLYTVPIFSTTTLTNCTVSGNAATGNGGGLYIGGNNKATLTDCTVSGNSAVNGAGAFSQGFAARGLHSGRAPYVVMAYAQANLTNCLVVGNSASGNGGGLATSGFATATLTNTNIGGNTAVNGGGAFTQTFTQAVRLTRTVTVTVTGVGTNNLTNCIVADNKVSGSGGGLDNTAGCSTNLSRTNVSFNSASTGGGIANQGTLSVDLSAIIGNLATSAGGGVSTTGGSATFTKSAILDNFVNSSGTALGGGIDCENSTLSLTNCLVNANQANGVTALGGGIYALNSTVTVQDSTVNANKANGLVLGEGGGMYIFNCVLNLSGSQVQGNKASTAFNDIFIGP